MWETALGRSLRGRGLALALCLLGAAPAVSLGQVPPAGERHDPVADAAEYKPVTEFDPKRDAASDIALAIMEARRTSRRVLLDVGGKWCIWCRIMDEYFAANADLLRLRDENYVTVKVNFSLENENKEVLSKYPEIPAYPHLFVLETDGTLLHSQPTDVLEKGKSYDREKMAAFLKKWAPAK